MNWLKQTYVSLPVCRKIHRNYILTLHQSGECCGHAGAHLWPRGHSVGLQAGRDNPLYGAEEGRPQMEGPTAHVRGDADVLRDGR
jgi:hypothetical protein